MSVVILAVAAIVLGAQNFAWAAPPANRVYVALGDSLAVGVGASEPQQTAYVPLLFEYFREQPRIGVRTLRNLARSGETSDSFIAGGQLAAALVAIKDPTRDTRVVTLDIGGNDLLFLVEFCRADPGGVACQTLVRLQLQKFAVNFGFIVAELKSALADDPGKETLYVMTYYNPYNGTGDPLESFADLALLGSDLRIDCSAPASDPRVGLNDLIACIGVANRAAVADVYPAFGDRAAELTHYAERDVHPNDAGYATIANTFIAAD